jgi:hypothetical protein
MIVLQEGRCGQPQKRQEVGGGRERLTADSSLLDTPEDRDGPPVAPRRAEGESGPRTRSDDGEIAQW